MMATMLMLLHMKLQHKSCMTVEVALYTACLPLVSMYENQLQYRQSVWPYIGSIVEVGCGPVGPLLGLQKDV